MINCHIYLVNVLFDLGIKSRELCRSMIYSSAKLEEF